MGALLLRCIV